MRAIPLNDVPVTITDGDLEVRTLDLDGLMLGVFRLPAGTDLRPALAGLEGDLCQCPHWGYMLSGRVRMHTPDGHVDFVAGEAFHWAAGHAPEALEDSAYVDFSPSDELRHVIAHITGAEAQTA